MPTEIARDQNGLFHVVRDGRPIAGPFGKDGDAAREARRRGGLTSTVIGRLYYEAPRAPEPEPLVLGTSDVDGPGDHVLVDPEDLAPVATVTRVSVPELLAGTVDFIRAALATETWDDLLDEIESTETAGKNRKGVHEAVAARRS